MTSHFGVFGQITKKVILVVANYLGNNPGRYQDDPLKTVGGDTICSLTCTASPIPTIDNKNVQRTLQPASDTARRLSKNMEKKIRIVTLSHVTS